MLSPSAIGGRILEVVSKGGQTFSGRPIFASGSTPPKETDPLLKHILGNSPISEHRERQARRRVVAG